MKMWTFIFVLGVVGTYSFCPVSYAGGGRDSMVDELVAMEKADPLKPTFLVPKIDECIVGAFPREFVVGKWQAMHQTDELVIFATGARPSRTVSSSEFLDIYDFCDDGTYTQEKIYNGKTSLSHGRWSYRDGLLSIFIKGQGKSLTRRRFRIDWFSEDEMAIRWRTDKSEQNYWDDYANGVKMFVNQRAWAKLSRDKTGCEIKELFFVGNNGAQYNKSISSPRRFCRISPTMKLKSTALYRILQCERVAGTDFSYDFSLQLTDEGAIDVNIFASIQQSLRASIKKEYAEAMPGVDARSIYVDFTRYSLVGDKIEGRALVLTMSVAAMNYDPVTHKGVMSVKISAGQLKEARKYIRKNIETLARDKNIALVTGEIPPAAKFYLGREEIKDGNILEIEFKTE